MISTSAPDWNFSENRNSFTSLICNLWGNRRSVFHDLDDVHRKGKKKWLQTLSYDGHHPPTSSCPLLVMRITNLCFLNRVSLSFLLLLHAHLAICNDHLYCWLCLIYALLFWVKPVNGPFKFIPTLLFLNCQEIFMDHWCHMIKNFFETAGPFDESKWESILMNPVMHMD